MAGRTCSIARMRRSGSSMPPDDDDDDNGGETSTEISLLYMHARKSCTAGITSDGFDSVSRSVESLFTFKGSV